MKIIQSITDEGIIYIDEKGSEKYIDFRECNENWIQYRKRAHNLTDDMLIALERDKCVGQRDICAMPCYIEFFTKPFTRIELTGEMSILESKEALRNLHKKILAYGWRTLDLS